MPEPPFWAIPREALLQQVRSGEKGLSARDAEERRAEQGPNLVAFAAERPAVLDLLSRFASPLVLVLLVASGIAGVLGDLRSFAIIGVVVATSVLLDFVQERRARSAAARLRKRVEARATVLRDGAPVTVPASELVVGDVVMLEAGDRVPADGRLLECNALQLHEAALTGEPYPVDKRAVDLSGARTPLDADNAVFAGTSVVAGTGLAVVATIGSKTELARAAQALHHPPPPRPFERGTHDFGALIVRFTLLLVIFVLMVHALSGRPFLESLLFALALAVGLTPELLPMIVSVTLARGALRMADAGVIVKRLAAIHDLGSMDVLCTDKTGTLTEARVAVVSCVDPSGHDAPEVRAWARTCASLSRAHASPVDEALARTEGPEIEGTVRVLDEVPFDPVHRRSAMLVEDEGVHTLFVKGAAEDVLADCRAEPAGVRERIAAMFAEGMRVLAISRKDVPTSVTRVEPHELVDLELFGFVALADPPKQGAREALERLRSRGVAVKIVTGDHELVARHVARALDLPVGEALTGRDIDALDDAALRVRVRAVDLFCRTTPVQKNRVVNALKAAGNVVGYLGDGINDGPPLHSADVGVSVETAVDVAKDAADLILSRQDLGVLEQGVMEGRRTVANVTKYVLMATSSNFGNMVSMAVASLFIPFLPLLPVQILVNNMLYDVSEIALPFDDVDDEAIAQPRRWDIGYVRRFMLGVGPMSSLFDALTFFVLLRILHVDEATFRSGWFVESIVSQVAVIFVIRTTRGAFRSHPSGWLALSSLAIIAVAIALPFSPLGAWLALVPLPPRTLGLLLAIVVVYLGVVELAKTRLVRWARSSRAPVTTARDLRRESA